ncbi:MAG: hypothetical protein HY961_00020 [Ignavibacteriae bacterium]|nr:hypothetical protein [Ignavibacteriota bacterium]
MAETLGSLCDKLTVVKLKVWHNSDPVRLESLSIQETRLQNEINEFVDGAVTGRISPDDLTFASNKIYNEKGNAIAEIDGTIGDVFSKLAEVNCKLWHEQEKVYEFEKVPAESKDRVVKSLALLNLERTKCIDLIDKKFYAKVCDKVLGMNTCSEFSNP